MSAHASLIPSRGTLPPTPSPLPKQQAPCSDGQDKIQDRCAIILAQSNTSTFQANIIIRQSCFRLKHLIQGACLTSSDLLLVLHKAQMYATSRLQVEQLIEVLTPLPHLPQPAKYGCRHRSEIAWLFFHPRWCWHDYGEKILVINWRVLIKCCFGENSQNASVVTIH